MMHLAATFRLFRSPAPDRNICSMLTCCAQAVLLVLRGLALDDLLEVLESGGSLSDSQHPLRATEVLIAPRAVPCCVLPSPGQPAHLSSQL